MCPSRAATPSKLEAAWADRVRANRDQAERLRETQPSDFYAPVTACSSPTRDGPASRRSTRSWRWRRPTTAGSTSARVPAATRCRWRSRCARSSPSSRPPACAGALRTGIDEHGDPQRPGRRRRWPDALDGWARCRRPTSSLIAHVGYDIEAIGPFLDAMEAATRDRASRCSRTAARPRWPTRSGRSSTARSASRCRPCRTSWSCSGPAAETRVEPRRALAADVRLGRRRSRRSSAASCSSPRAARRTSTSARSCPSTSPARGWTLLDPRGRAPVPVPSALVRWSVPRD